MISSNEILKSINCQNEIYIFSRIKYEWFKIKKITKLLKS